MAFSMFLRNPVCNNRLLSQQVLKLASQPSLVPKTMSTFSNRSLLSNDVKTTTPIMDAMRTFKTSAVCMSDNHSRVWIVEKATAALLVPLVPIGILLPNKLTDMVLAILIVAHTFWGLEAIAVDYVRASIFGPFIPKLAVGLVYLISIVTLAGLFYLISHDIGIANCFRKLWAIKSDEKSA